MQLEGELRRAIGVAATAAATLLRRRQRERVAEALVVTASLWLARLPACACELWAR